MTDESALASQPAETTTPASTPADPTTNLEAEQTTTPETPAETTAEAPPAEGEKPEGEEGERPRKPTGSQRLKRRLAAIEADFQATQAELETLRRQQTQPQRQDGRPGVDREPKESDFPNDYYGFERARTQWEVRQAVREENARGAQHRDQVARNEAHLERLEAYEDNATEARDRIPDFDKVVRAATDINLKAEVVEELLASDKSALLQYHLAKNPDKARELNGMSGKELAREIGRLESRVHLPTPKKATQATPPPSQPRGGAAPHVTPETANDMETYVALRKKQMAKA